MKFLRYIFYTIRYTIHYIDDHNYSTRVFSTDLILPEFSAQTLFSGMILSQTPRRGLISRALGPAPTGLIILNAKRPATKLIGIYFLRRYFYIFKIARYFYQRINCISSNTHIFLPDLSCQLIHNKVQHLSYILDPVSYTKSYLNSIIK